MRTNLCFVALTVVLEATRSFAITAFTKDKSGQSVTGNYGLERISDNQGFGSAFFFADPDPGKNFDADPDPDPDPGGIRGRG